MNFDKWGVSLRRGATPADPMGGVEIGRFGPFSHRRAKVVAQDAAEQGTAAGDGVSVVLAPWAEIEPARRHNPGAAAHAAEAARLRRALAAANDALHRARISGALAAHEGRRVNPAPGPKSAGGSGCRDSSGAFIPIPECGAGPSEDPTDTAFFSFDVFPFGMAEHRLKLRGEYSTPAQVRNAAAELRKHYDRVRIKKFPGGSYGVYTYGHRKGPRE